MAFNINPGKQQFTATAAQTVFTFNFAIFVDTDIKAYKTLAGAVANDTTDLLTLTTHYTVSINGTLGGTVTLVSGASVNDTITLVRSLPITRTTDYVTNGDLFADTLDLDQDYQTYLVLDQNVQLQRAIVVPESLGNVDLDIPAPVANSYLRWNATADALENDTSIPDDVVTTTANVVLTNADVVLTHADVVLTHADVVLANKWAEEAEDVEVTTGEYSAHHWAIKAAASAASLTVDAVPTDGSANAVSSNGVFDALALKAPLSSPALTDTPTAPTATLGTNTTQIATTAFVLANATGTPSGVRQTVQSGSVDTSGFANFVSIGTGLAVNIAATTTPIVIHAAGGKVSDDRIGTISADTSITGLTANSTNYLYADVASNGVVTLSANVVAHLEQFGGTPAVTNNLTTFNYSGMTGYTGNGATAPQSWRVPIGEAVTNATNVTSVVNYALNGQYDSGYTATLPSVAAAVSKNHNIGTDILKCSIRVKCTTIDAGFAVGDIFDDISTVGGGIYPMQLNIVRTNKIMSFTTGDGGGGWRITNKSTGSLAAVTLASWSYKLIAQRGF